MIIFTPTERKAISRRLIKIPIENGAFLQAQSNTSQAVNDFMDVDAGNKEYYDAAQFQVTSYESEYSNLNGTVLGTFTESDLQNSASQLPGNLFFPTTAPFNYFLIPKIISEVNGGNSTTTAINENKIMTFPPAAIAPSGNGLSELISIMGFGFSYGIGATTTTAIYTIGSTTLNLFAAIGTSPGEYIYVSNISNSFVALVVAVNGPGTTLTIFPITNPGTNLAVGASVSKIFGTFLQTERQTLVANNPVRQDVLSGLATYIANQVTNWVNIIGAENALLAANPETRPLQISQNSLAVSANTTFLGQLAVWQAFPNTGVGGKYDNSSFNYLTGLFVGRQSQIGSRSTEILNALGGVVDNNDGTFTFLSSAQEPYYIRYEFLNTRINRAFGSLTRAVKLSSSTTSMQGLIDNNNFLFSTYSQNMSSSQFSKDSDGLNKISINDGSLFSPGDVGYVISETQPEISVIIRDVAQNIATLNVDIPNTYYKTDLARLYKVF